MDETLREAWRQQRLISAAARQQRRDQNVAQLVALMLGLTVTALVVAQAVLDENGYLAKNPLVEWFFYVAILVLPIMVAALAAATGRWRPGTRWILLRASSEAIKREIWRYRARAGTYSHAKTRRVSREVKLAEAVGSSIGGLMRTDVSQLAFDPAANASVDSDKLTPVTPDQYIAERIDDQIDYYLRTAAKLERRARLLRALALAFGAIGTFLAAIGLQIYVALTTAIVGACITIVESRQLETSVTFYNQAAADLSAIRAWWFALAPVEQRQPAMIDRLVERSERIMGAELTGWVQEMQDAMTQFRLDQSADRPPTGQPGAAPGPGREACALPREADADDEAARRTPTPTRKSSHDLTDAFISHSSANRNVALRIEKALEADGLTIWLDDSEIRLGILLGEELQGSIRAARVLVLLWSEAAASVALGRHGMADRLSRAAVHRPLLARCDAAPAVPPGQHPAQVQAGHARRRRGPRPRHPRIAERFRTAWRRR